MSERRAMAWALAIMWLGATILAVALGLAQWLCRTGHGP